MTQPHPSLEVLLDADAVASAEVRAHLAGCAECARELHSVRLRRAALRALPLLSPPTRLSSTVLNASTRSRRRRVAARLMLIAAAAALAAVALWPVVRGVPGQARVNAVETLIGRSQALEADLRAVPEPSVVHVEDADARAEIEDEIAWVDQCLAELAASAPDSERAALWKTRISLLECLLKLRRPPTALVSL